MNLATAKRQYLYPHCLPLRFARAFYRQPNDDVPSRQTLCRLHKKNERCPGKMAAAMDDSSNSTIEGLMSSLSSLGADPDTSLAFQNNGGGFLNHKMYFATMSPDGQRTPTSDSALEKAIVASFGSFDKFKEEMSTAAKGVFGSGWHSSLLTRTANWP